ncbi:MAG: hypothetical protein HKN21_11405 [Candidatus Eisenbacteria bacterium]|uniref:Fibronectin type-III domain-containing protein n=1 Tax=Eiseniibacteriota bacterium TaxID=2212470 RepID=A0A7Y2H351_UNCEI|nr:hypothetical protein [Candidatus Eisenbacteria bacterium]
MRRLAMRTLAATTLLALVLSACGHNVDPSEDFKDPDQIPNVTNFEAVANLLGVKLTWISDPIDFAVIDGFYIYRAVVVGGEEPVFQRLTPEPYSESSEYQDQDVDDGTTYRYEIRAVTPAGVESNPTPPWTVRVDFTPPAPPTNLQTTESGTPTNPTVLLSWDASPDTDVDLYRIFRLPPFPGTTLYVEWRPRLYEDIFVERTMMYRYYIQAVDIAGNVGPESEVVQITISGP